MVKKLTISDNESTDNESVVSDIETKQEELIKPIVKSKKVLSELQKESLRKGREKGREKLIEKFEKQKLS